MNPVQMATAIAVFLAVLAGSMAASSEQFKQKVGPVVELCKNQTGATDADATSALNMDLDYSENGKCLVKCLLEHLVILKDGEFVPYEQNEKTYQSLFAGDPEQLPHARSIVNSCQADAKELLSNQCEAAYSAIVCVAAKLS